MTNTGNNNLQGQIVYSENDAKDSVENAYDKCEAGANDVGNVATLRQTLSDNAKQFKAQLDLIEQGRFSGSTSDFQTAVGQLAANVGALDANLAALKQDVDNAQKFADFVKFLADTVNLAIAIGTVFSLICDGSTFNIVTNA